MSTNILIVCIMLFIVKVFNTLEKADILPSEIDGLEECSKDDRPFAGLETGFQQLKYYKENFNFVVIYIKYKSVISVQF